MAYDLATEALLTGRGRTMRVLVVEDDLEVAGYLCRGLGDHGHRVDHAADGGEGLICATEDSYDVIVMDRMLPVLDGLTVVETLRGAGNKTPILVLSALSDVGERVIGLRAGADDYLAKPFSFPEVLARVESLGRRRVVVTGSDTASPVLRVGDLELDTAKRAVRRAGKPIDVQPRELQLLEFFMRRPGQVVTRSMLLEGVWDCHFDPQASVIDVHVTRLRQKIDRDAPEPMLHTIRHVGYCLRTAA